MKNDTIGLDNTPVYKGDYYTYDDNITINTKIDFVKK
jgi:hypothetical protein